MSWVPAVVDWSRVVTSALFDRIYAQQLIVPAVSFTGLSKTASYRVRKMNYALSRTQIITDYACPFAPTNYSLCVAFVSPRERYVLWRGANARLFEPDYESQVLPQEFALEIWIDPLETSGSIPVDCAFKLSSRGNVVAGTTTPFTLKEVRSTPTTFPSKEYAI